MDLIGVLFSQALIRQATAGELLASASVDSAGLVSFKNSNGTTLFTLQLPLYAGGVE